MPIAPEPITSSDLGNSGGTIASLVGPDELAVGLEARKLAGARAGRQDHVLGGERDVALVVHRDGELALPAVAAGELGRRRRTP